MKKLFLLLLLFLNTLFAANTKVFINQEHFVIKDAPKQENFLQTLWQKDTKESLSFSGYQYYAKNSFLDYTKRIYVYEKQQDL